MPPPPDARPLSREGFAVLLSMLVSSTKLDGRALSEAVDAADLKTKVMHHLFSGGRCLGRCVPFQSMEYTLMEYTFMKYTLVEYTLLPRAPQHEHSLDSQHQHDLDSHRA